MKNKELLRMCSQTNWLIPAPKFWVVTHRLGITNLAGDLIHTHAQSRSHMTDSVSGKVCTRKNNTRCNVQDALKSLSEVEVLTLRVKKSETTVEYFAELRHMRLMTFRWYSWSFVFTCCICDVIRLSNL